MASQLYGHLIGVVVELGDIGDFLRNARPFRDDVQVLAARTFQGHVADVQGIM
jgi:hypothetical protein